MHQALIIVLIGVLGASLASFLVSGLRNNRRRAALNRNAHEIRMHFSGDDPFDVPCRYARFALVAAGHSTVASNVTHGRLGRWPIRAFDFRYEIGHGPRRTTRHYNVVAVETDLSLPSLMLWHKNDLASAPVRVLHARATLGDWASFGSADASGAVLGVLQPRTGECISMQACDSVIMLCKPVRRHREKYADLMDTAVRVASELEPFAAASCPPPAIPDSSH